MKVSDSVCLLHYEKNGICLQCVKLPVGGRPGVEDVLFGREQRQAVGIKVDRSRVHAGKSFQTTQLLSSLLPTAFGVGVSAGGKKQPQRNTKGCSRPRKQQRKYAGSCSVGLSSKLERSVQALRTHSVEETATAHWSLCSGVD